MDSSYWTVKTKKGGKKHTFYQNNDIAVHRCPWKDRVLKKYPNDLNFPGVNHPTYTFMRTSLLDDIQILQNNQVPILQNPQIPIWPNILMGGGLHD